MILTTQNGISFYRFQHLTNFAGIRHAIFFRTGGFSDQPFKSLNVSFGLGDEDKNVERNRQRVAQCIDGQDFIYLKQIHGQNIVVLARSEGKAAPEIFKQPLIGDAVVTNIPDKFLVVQAADCQSVLLCDPVGLAVREKIFRSQSRSIVAAERGVGRAQVALAWMLSKPFVTSPIVGATKEHHIDDAVAAVELTLSADEIARLEEPYTPHHVVGFR